MIAASSEVIEALQSGHCPTHGIEQQRAPASHDTADGGDGRATPPGGSADPSEGTGPSGEEELVVFASRGGEAGGLVCAGKGLANGWREGKPPQRDPQLHSTGSGEVPRILSQPIAEVDAGTGNGGQGPSQAHSGNGPQLASDGCTCQPRMARQPVRGGTSRPFQTSQTEPCIAQRPGHPDVIADSGTRAKQWARSRRLASGAHRQRQLSSAGDVSSQHRNPVGASQTAQAAPQPADLGQAKAPRNAQGHQTPPRSRSHRRQVGEIHRQGLGPDVQEGRGGSTEVNAFQQGVHRDAARALCWQNRGIVARTERRRGRGSGGPDERLDELELAGHSAPGRSPGWGGGATVRSGRPERLPTPAGQ
jgi:hypothetical protein